MKNRFILFSVLVLSILFASSCKSEFEKLRATADPDTLYKSAFEYYEKEEYLKAQTLFELIINNLRGKVEAEKVYFYYANTHYKLRKYILASYYYKNFSSTFPNSQYREEADFMSAFANYQLSPSFRLEQSSTEQSIDEFQLFVNTYPNSPRVEEANKLIDQMRIKLERKAYEQAELYFNLRQYQSATHTFENMLKDFPDTRQAEKIRYMIVQSSYLLAENSIFERQKERFEETIKYSNTFIYKYPNSKYVKEVKSIKKYSNNQLKKFKV